MAIVFVGLAVGAYAQSERYTNAMKQQVTQLDSMRTPEQYQQIANTLERITNAEKQEWLPPYYAAYALIMKSYFVKNVAEVDPLINKADEFIALAESLQSNNSEITTLKAMGLSARMRVDMSRGMTMGPKATMLLEKALKEGPSNPRAMVQMAQMKFYTPPAFGGGKAEAIAYLEKALTAYESSKPASEIHPHWGQGYAKRLHSDWTK